MSPRAVGVCSWSLEPRSATDLIEGVRAVGLDRVQLALDPIRRGDLPRDLPTSLHAAGISVASGMMAMAGEDYSSPASIRRTGGVVPDDTWPANLEAARANARLAAEIGVRLVTFHAGFISHDPADRGRRVLPDRLRALADLFAGRGIEIGLETGQERADTLGELLDDLDHPALGVNFDPANIILYGMGDPVEALRRVAPRVVQIHLKDALPARRPDEWGTEVPVGEGAVDWAPFFTVVQSLPRPVDLMIEREAGTDRRGDIARAVGFVRHLGLGSR